MSMNRRTLLKQVGHGMILAGVGAACATDLGIPLAHADDAPVALDFGKLEPLVQLMQESDPDALIRALAERLRQGERLSTLLTAGALANARTFGGQDYIGFHTFMALAPAYRMALQLPTEQQALPVLKVLHRNASRIQALGGRSHEVLHALSPEAVPASVSPGEHLRSVARTGDIDRADRVMVSLDSLPAGEAFQHLMMEVEEEVDVHRVVLAWRAIDTLDIAGAQWANCLLRQSIRYCANTEHQMIANQRERSPIRQLLPEFLDQYHLLSNPSGKKSGDDRWLGELANAIYAGSRPQASDAVAQAIRDGYALGDIAEAVSIAANKLVLHDRGRPEAWANAEKPVGSCHGDSIGVHASDAANAWRNIVRVSDDRSAISALIVAAFHTAGQTQNAEAQGYPLAEQCAKVKAESEKELLQEADAAVRAGDQMTAAAVIKRYSQLGYAAAPVMELMLRHATTEDGALHAEKYYYTATTEFATTRPAFRWNQLIALARVTASEYGRSSPGYQAAKEALGTGV